MISRLVLRNYGPFRGEHVLDLEPTVYAVVARTEDDPDASNFAGKSWLLSAVRFALFGSHPADREDGLVTRGEREGGVVMTLSDGLAVERSRRVGGTTQLLVGDARGRDAQQLVERRVGLCEADFLACSFFAQKRMARFVTAGPAERSEEVSAWLRLDRLRRAHRRASDLASELALRESLLAAEESALRARLAQFSVLRPGAVAVGPPCDSGRGCGLAGCPGCSLVPDVLLFTRTIVGLLEDRAASAAQELGAGEAELAASRRLLGLGEAVRHGDQLRAEVAELEALGDDEPDLTPLAARADEARCAHHAAAAEADQKRLLAGGKFSGTCPVNRGACPATREINADLKLNRALSERADGERRAKAAASAYATAKLERARGALAALQARRVRLRALREQLTRVDASTPPLEPGTAIPDAGAVHRLELHVRGLRDFEREAALDLDRARRAAAEVSDLSAELDRVCDERQRAASELRTAREAVVVLGRAGAQRRVAEGALREVESGACGLLAEAGVDLSVSLAWDRPTDQPAPGCAACGAALPPSRRVRECPACGAPRGPKLAEGLEVALSKRSGFAEDAAGIALSLSASAWLRRARDVQWPVLCADEPWSAADRKNQRALLSLFRLVTARCGLRQMLLVAHQDGVMDGLPGRIEVVAGPQGSRVSVVR